MWIPVESRGFVPSLISPGDEVMFLTPRLTLASTGASAGGLEAVQPVSGATNENRSFSGPCLGQSAGQRPGVVRRKNPSASRERDRNRREARGEEKGDGSVGHFAGHELPAGRNREAGASEETMKVWFNKINESRRSVVEVGDSEVTIGRDPGNTVCLQSPLVSRRHAVVRLTDGKLHLENVGLNSCVVGEEEVLGGQSAVFEPGTKVRIWPYTLTFEAEKAAVDHPRRNWRPISARSWPTWSCASTASCWNGSTSMSSRAIAAAIRRAFCCWRTTSRTCAASWSVFAPRTKPCWRRSPD